MGADIHFYIETRKDSKAKWDTEDFHVAEITTYEDNDSEEEDFTLEAIYDEYSRYGRRDYAMFGVLADVRGDGIIYGLRGIPLDVSANVQRAIDNYGEDGHSHHFLSLDEFKECLDKYKIMYTNRSAPDYDEIYRLASNWLMNEQAEAKLLDTERDPQIRFVFFFDN